MPEIIYAAIRAIDESWSELHRFICPDVSQKVFCHHLTLGFGANVNPYHISNIGKKAVIRTTRIIGSMNPFLLCIQVDENVHKFGCTNLFPHITISCGNDVEPIQSNDVIRRLYEGDNTIKSQKCELTLEGVVDLFVKTPDGKGKWYLE